MHGRTSRRRGVIEPSPCREEFIKQIQSPERKRRARPLSRQNVLNHIPVHVGQPEITSAKTVG